MQRFIATDFRRFSAALAATLIATACLPATLMAELVLVEDGASRAPIVLFEDAPPKTREAAEELALYIEKISGARPELIEGKPDPLPEHAIWVGYQPVLDSLFPQQDFDFAHPEQILIAANDDHLVLAGRDRWDPDKLVITGRKFHVEGKQQEYGTVNAVFTFLEDYLDVRWLWPGELGIDIVEQKTIRFEPFATRYHPQIRARAGMFPYSEYGVDLPRGRSGDWMRHQRVQLDSLDVPGGHAFDDWWDRFGEERRELFALQPNGTRGPINSARTVKLCLSNPAVVDQWLKDVRAQLEQDPNQRLFNASPNDGWASGHCICEDCRAWDHPDGELRTFQWEGIGQQYVALSDRHVTFANRCARRLNEEYPDKDYYVVMLAYGHSRPAPIEARPDDNVIISSVANFFLRSDATDRGSSNDTPHRVQLAHWAKVTPNLMWRPNLGGLAGYKQGQLDVSITQAIDDIKYVADRGTMAFFFDRFWEHWATQGPVYYVTTQLAWDPSQDAQAIMDDYYQRGFGPAAKTIETYWDHVEQSREALNSSGRPQPEIYDQAFFDTMYGLLDKAAEQLADAPAKYRQRIDFVRAGLDYQRLMVDIRALMARYRDSDNQDTEAANKVRENWTRIMQIAERHPYAININPLKPQNDRMRGLHPDYEH